MATLDIPSVEELDTDTIEEIENTISDLEDLSIEVHDHPYMDDEDLEAVHDVITDVYELHDNAMIS